MNRLPCPACKTIVQFPDDLAGQALPCPRCKKVLRISLAAGAARPPGPAPAASSARRPARKNRGSARPFAILAAAVVLLVAGGGVGVFYLAGNEPGSTPQPRVRPSQQAARSDKEKRSLSTPKPAAVSTPEPRETATQPVSEEPTLPAARLPRAASPDPVPAPPKSVEAPSPKPEPSPSPKSEEPAPAPEVVSQPSPSPKTDVVPGDAETAALASKVLARLNTLRVAAGVITVRPGPDLCRGCRDHARYLVRNAILKSKEGASPYWEDAQLPGFTELGARIARSAHIDNRGPLAAIDRWAASPVQRTLLLSPQLQMIGLGLARASAKEEWTAVFTFPLPRATPAAGAVLYPGDQQTSVPLAFPGNEVPDPLPLTKDKVAGYPITVTFPPRVRIEKPTWELEDDRGKVEDTWFSSPSQPANKSYVPHQQNTLCLITRKPLRPGTRYAVHVAARAAGKRWSATWTFVTLGHDQGRKDMEARVLAGINAYRKAAGVPLVTLNRALSKQCMAHAAYLAQNQGSHPDLNLHDEDPSLPGYSEEGRSCARYALLRSFGNADDAVRGMMASILNRSFVLNPVLSTVGIGFAPHPGLGHYWALHLTANGFPTTPRSQPILFPSKNQRDVALAYPGGDRPSPIPPEAKSAGFAVTALFPAGTLTHVHARLMDSKGKEVECWLHSPDKPLIRGTFPTLIGLLPRRPLTGGATYKVGVAAQLNGRSWQLVWSFQTTGAADALQQEMASRALERVNEVRKAAGLAPVKLDEQLSHDCLLHARYLVTNAKHPAVQGLGVHNEDPTLPDATPEGGKSGKSSVIAWSPDPLTSVDDWVSTLYHRIPLLSPDLKRIGFAALPRYEDDHWYSVLDSGRGK